MKVCDRAAVPVHSQEEEIHFNVNLLEIQVIYGEIVKAIMKQQSSQGVLRRL